MPRHRQRITFMMLNEATWHTPEGEHRVIGGDTDADGRAMWVVRRPDGDQVLMTPLAVADAINESMRPAGAELMPHVDRGPDDEWAGVPERERIRLEKRARDLTKAITGSPFGNISTGGRADGKKIDPRFDPAKFSQEERIARLHEDLKVENEKSCAVRTLLDHYSILRNNHGRPRALAHKAYGTRKDPAADASPELRTAIHTYVLDRVDRETMSKANLLTDFRNKHVDLLTDVKDTVWQTALEQFANVFNLFDPAVTRRSKSVRTPERQGLWVCNRPFESVQLDSTPLDVLAMDDRGQMLGTIHLVWAVDPFCSKVRALRIVAGDEPFTAETVKHLLLDVVAQRLLGMPYVPGQIGASPMLPTHVGLGTVITDRGSQFTAVETLGQNAGFQVHAVIAPPGRGDRKPHVESRFRGLALIQELLPGAKSSNTGNRGLHPEKYPMLSIGVLTQILVLLVEGVIHNTPMNKLHPETNSAVTMTPNEIEEQYYRTNGAVEVDAEYYRAIELFETSQRVINDDGIRVKNLRYWDPALEPLRLLTRRESDGKHRRVTVYIADGYPEAIIVRDPTGLPMIVPQVGASTAPVLGDLLARDTFERALGGAIGAREVQELKDALIQFANDAAVKPQSDSRKQRGRRKPASKPRRTPSTSASADEGLTDVYANLLARKQNRGESDV